MFAISKRIGCALLLTSAASAFAVDDLPERKSFYRAYEVSITNATQGQSFTPQLLVTHAKDLALFELGQPASTQLEVLAEGGSTGEFTQSLMELGQQVSDVQTIDGLIVPGATASTVVLATRGTPVLSIAAMMIPTNDTFMSLNAAKLPRWGTKTFYVPAYDAGTEENDQLCIHMPGPRCGGEGYSPEPSVNDEGFVYISNGFHDLGSEDAAGNEILSPVKYDWRNPVAKVVVKRLY